MVLLVLVCVCFFELDSPTSLVCVRRDEERCSRQCSGSGLSLSCHQLSSPFPGAKVLSWSLFPPPSYALHPFSHLSTYARTCLFDPTPTGRRRRRRSRRRSKKKKKFSFSLRPSFKDVTLRNCVQGFFSCSSALLKDFATFFLLWNLSDLKDPRWMRRLPIFDFFFQSAFLKWMDGCESPTNKGGMQIGSSVETSTFHVSLSMFWHPNSMFI